MSRQGDRTTGLKFGDPAGAKRTSALDQMGTIRLLAVLTTLLLVVLGFLRLQRGASKSSVKGVSHLVPQDPEMTLVEAMGKVQIGATKEDVESIAGRADNPDDKEWTYYLNRESGYLITFDDPNRVEAVQSWKA